MQSTTVVNIRWSFVSLVFVVPQMMFTVNYTMSNTMGSTMGEASLRWKGEAADSRSSHSS